MVRVGVTVIVNKKIVNKNLTNKNKIKNFQPVQK